MYREGDEKLLLPRNYLDKYNYLEALPPELILRIVKELPIEDLIELGQCSQRMKKIIFGTDEIWRRLTPANLRDKFPPGTMTVHNIMSPFLQYIASTSERLNLIDVLWIHTTTNTANLIGTVRVKGLRNGESEIISIAQVNAMQNARPDLLPQVLTEYGITALREGVLTVEQIIDFEQRVGIHPRDFINKNITTALREKLLTVEQIITARQDRGVVPLPLPFYIGSINEDTIPLLREGILTFEQMINIHDSRIPLCGLTTPEIITALRERVFTVEQIITACQDRGVVPFPLFIWSINKDTIPLLREGILTFEQMINISDSLIPLFEFTKPEIITALRERVITVEQIIIMYRGEFSVFINTHGIRALEKKRLIFDKNLCTAQTATASNLRLPPPLQYAERDSFIMRYITNLKRVNQGFCWKFNTGAIPTTALDSQTHDAMENAQCLIMANDRGITDLKNGDLLFESIIVMSRIRGSFINRLGTDDINFLEDVLPPSEVSGGRIGGFCCVIDRLVLPRIVHEPYESL